MLCNTRSVLNKTFILNDLILSQNLDFLLLAETCLKPGNSCPLVELCPPNYQTLNLPRSTGHGGGIASVFKNNFTCIQITWGTFKSFELLFFKINCEIPVCCLVVNWPPQPNNALLNDLSKLLTSVVLKYDRIIMAGDFNVHIDNFSYTFATNF